MPQNTNYEVKITGVVQGDVWQNVLHYQMTSAGVLGRTADVGSLMEAVKATLIPLIVACQTADVQTLSARINEVGVAEPIIQKDAINTPGTASGDLLPASDAVLFTKRCNTGGRKNVGHLYLVGVPDDKAQGGIVDTGWDPLEDLAVGLKTNLTNAGDVFAPIIWHRGPTTAEFVTKVDVRAQMSRQNRRTLPAL